MIELELKLRRHGRWLHRQAQRENPLVLPWFEAFVPQIPPQELPGMVLRRHALALIAARLGCRSWVHLRRVLARESDDWGASVHHNPSGARLLHWCRDLAEARALRAQLHRQTPHYVFPYRTQFFVADADYVRALGSDPEAPDWESIQWDWVGLPEESWDSQAWARLFAGILERRLVWDREPHAFERKALRRLGGHR